MPQKVLKFTGINRKVNEFQNSGACEELINLRPQTGSGYSVVRPKEVIEESAQEYDGFFVHAFGDRYNQIVIHHRRGVDWINSPSGVVNITGEFASKQVSLTYAGNVLIIYCEEENRQLVFRFEDGRYKPYDVAIRTIKNAEIHFTYTSTGPASNTAVADDASVEAANDALQKAASGFYGIYPNGLCGAAVIGCAYELDDGSEVWSTSFIVANVARVSNYTKPEFDNSSLKARVTGASKVSLNLTFDSAESFNVRKVNIYATRPVFPYELENTGGENHKLNELPLNDVGVNLDGQLMYYQGYVIPKEGIVSFSLNFGREQAGDDIMDVNAGCIERTGRAVSYNNRFHFYRSEVQHMLQIPTVSYILPRGVGTSRWVAYVKFGDTWKLIDKQYHFYEGQPLDFIYPMAGVKKMIFVKAAITDMGDFSVPYEEMFTVSLEDSSAYNYSFAFDVTPAVNQIDDGLYNEWADSGQLWGGTLDTKVFWKSEMNAINVSAQYNPFVFPVEYSYSFGGEILDIATSYLPISSTQIGQYPLTVFTSNGIYALEQGSGAVLYGNIVPLQPMVIDGKAVSTPSGIFFISSRSVFVLSGRDAANVSHILNGSIEESVKSTDAFQTLCCSGRRGLFNFQPHLCDEEFEDFVQGATMAYDQLNNELIISNPDDAIMYSYVFNLDTRSYHKIPRKYAGVQNGARYAIEVSTGGRNIVDMHIENEAKQPILLQSRPLPLDAFFTHIQRLVFLADASLDGGDNLCLSVFASDNLNDWKCIISAQKHDATFRQIRTNRAARSYRDYVILINGTVSTRTDISDIIADYTIVKRRLG